MKTSTLNVKIIQTVVLVSLPVWILLFCNFKAASQNSGYSIEQITEIEWNKPNGLTYKRGYDGNYAVTAFTMINPGTVAFLSGVERQIVLFDIEKQQKKGYIGLRFPSLNFMYADNKFYVSGIYKIAVYSRDGKLLRSYPYPDKIKAVNRLVYQDGKLYVLAHNQKSYLLENNNKPTEPKAINGWIVAPDVFVKTIKQNRHEYSLVIFNESGKQCSRTFKTEKNLASVQCKHFDGKSFYLDLEYIKNNIPLETEREIVVVDYENQRFQHQKKLTSLPNIYYVDIQKDISIFNSEMYYLLTTPENAALYCFKKNNTRNTGQIQRFSKELLSTSYHFNTHTLTLPEKEKKQVRSTKEDSIVEPISRSEIIARAEAFETHVWEATEDNIYDHVYCDEQYVISAPYIEVSTDNRSIPYMWDGFSSIEQFDTGMEEGLSAGNINTSTSIGSLNCAEGVDCSGFVSRAWNTEYKYDTREFYPILEEYDIWEEMLPGDVANKAGHIRMLHSWNDDGTMLMIEATSKNDVWRVTYFNYTIADLQYAYEPYYLYSVTDDVTAINEQESDNNLRIYPNPVTELMTISTEKTDNEQVTFRIYNTQGKLIEAGKFCSAKHTVDVHYLPKGVYFVEIRNEKQCVTKKIVKR